MTVSAAITCDSKIQNRSLESMVQRWVSRLEDVEPSIVSCAVSIEPRGGHIRVRVDVTVPEFEINVVQESRLSAEADLSVAVYDAFRAARHRLIARASNTA